MQPIKQPETQESRPLVPLQSGGRSMGQAELYRTLLEINNAIVTSLTREELLEAVAHVLRQIAPFDQIIIYDPDQDAFRIVAIVGSHELQHFAARQWLTREMVLGNRPFDRQHSILNFDLALERQTAQAHALFADGFRSFCGVPMIYRDQLLGGIGFASKTPNQYTEADSRFLQEVADQVALAVANMKSYEEIEALRAKESTAAEHRRTLLEINNAIITNLSQEDLFRAVFQALKRAIPFDKVGLTFHEPDLDGLRFFALGSLRHWEGAWPQGLLFW